MTPFIDTHCHLDLYTNIKETVDIEDEFKIKTITVTNAPFLWKHNESLFKHCRNIRPALGFHPELAAKRIRELELFDALSNNIKYIGEIGLDGSPLHRETQAQQLKVFRAILNNIQSLSTKILTVHSRNAAEQTIIELRNSLKSTYHKVILHWFTGSKNELELALKEDFYFSINHKMMYSKKGLELIKHIPVNRILTETDAPFTFDDRVTNRKQSLDLTIKGLSALWNISYQESQDRVYINFKTLLSQ